MEKLRPLFVQFVVTLVPQKTHIVL
jgi:hypothetical protein